MRIETLARPAAWFLFCAIVALTCVPPAWRVVTGASHTLEHAGAFFLVGGLFALGYRRSPLAIGALAAAVTGMLELMQLFIPGRHARVSDFVINAVGICMGIAAGSFCRWLLQRREVRRHSAGPRQTTA